MATRSVWLIFSTEVYGKGKRDVTTVWPDLVKYRHYGKRSKGFWSFVEGLFLIGLNFYPISEISFLLGNFLVL